MRATKVNAGLAESNGKLLLGIWRDSLHVTCVLTACTPGSAPGPTLGNEYGKTLPFTFTAGFMTHVTCRLTAKNRDQLRNPTLGNRAWATSTFLCMHVYTQQLDRTCEVVDITERCITAPDAQVGRYRVTACWSVTQRSLLAHLASYTTHHPTPLNSRLFLLTGLR